MDISDQNREAAWNLLCETEYLLRYWSGAHQRVCTKQIQRGILASISHKELLYERISRNDGRSDQEMLAISYP